MNEREQALLDNYRAMRISERKYTVVEFADGNIFHRFDEDDWWLYIEGDLERYEEDDVPELEEAYQEIYSQMIHS